MFSLYPIRVDFPLTSLSRVEGVSLICLRTLGSMDTARLEINVLPGDFSQYVTAGSPLRISWVDGHGNRDQFIGYVHSFRPSSEGFAPRTRLIAVGAAYPMFNESQRTFYRVGIHNIAREIATDYRFQLDTEPHPYVNEQVLQQSDSDWAFLHRLAKEWGYVLLSQDVNLTFRPQQLVLEENYRTAERLKTYQSVNPEVTSLVNFEPSYSATGKNPAAVSGGQGVGPIQVAPIRWSQEEDAGVFEEAVTARAITSELEGEMVVRAEEARGRFPFSAKATIIAPAGKKPLDVYQITHNNKKVTWVVQSVKHIVTGDTYLGEFVLGSDGRDYVSNSAQKRVDVSVALRRNEALLQRGRPVVIDSRPIFLGAGPNRVVSKQRWKSHLLHTPIGEEVA